jgi:hypothetical protein
VELAERLFVSVGSCCGCVEVTTAGDGYLATFDGPGPAGRCAEAIIDALGAIDVLPSYWRILSASPKHPNR